MSNSAALQLENVSHFFGEHQVLNSVSLNVNHGSITALLGPSGGGKTTLLRIVAGFERPTRGTVRINGTVVADAHTWIPTRERGVAIVPQEGALFPHLSVSENVAFGLKKRRSIETQTRVEEMLELVGLPDAANARPSDLSGGMQQRIALARALATNPTLVLLDEPFSALDAGLRETLREQVVTILRRAGATAIWVTHDQDEALSISDRIAVMHQGYIVELGDANDIYQNPIHPYTRALLTAIPQPDPHSKDKRIKLVYEKGDINYEENTFIEVSPLRYVLGNEELIKEWSVRRLMYKYDNRQRFGSLYCSN